jgi:hypothetical protein
LKTLCHHSTIRLNVVYDLYYLWMLPLDFSVKYLKCTLFLSKSGQLHWLCYKQHCSVTDLNYYLTFLTSKQHCSVINLNYLFMLSTTRQRYQYRNHLKYILLKICIDLIKYENLKTTCFCFSKTWVEENL